ncbi:MAG: indolepyruvate oxidoreductase [Deltaproteobacteria bacterium]|nr:MAG: indolepyruvate oxidoreductase [Deltaproteobacteria bacterium]
MRKVKIIIAGVGGQGVVFLSRLLAEAAVQAGEPLISYESHGMAMRGGSVSCHLKIGGFQSPLIAAGEADVLLLLATEELPHVQHLLKDDGRLFVNGEEAGKDGGKGQISLVPASAMALEHNLPRAVNLIVAGFAAAHSDFPYSVDQLRAALEKMPAKETIRAANIAALELGCQVGL